MQESSGKADKLSERVRRLARSAGGRGSQRTRGDWAGEPAAIYCRMSHALDEDQTGVDRQERICRGVAERLGLMVLAEHVFVDNNRSAWQRNRKRKGWDALLEVARREGVRHIIAYHPDRLMRQPKDLEELLEISDDRNITLHGEANRRDLSDPDDRYFLRIEVAHACRSSDDTSRRQKAALEDRARDGKPHAGGQRRYGYEPDGMKIVPHEAAVVREVFDRYLDGETPIAIASDLNKRNIPTTTGKTWSHGGVRRMLDSPYYGGILIFRGEEIGPGEFPAIIDVGMFREVAERRSYRAATWAATTRKPRFYLLRGLVTCKRCGTRMGGAPHGIHRTYKCTRDDRLDDLRCGRRIKADKLESFVVDAAINVLERLQVSGREAATLLSDADTAAIEADRAELDELKDMWKARELTTREYREMRKIVEGRISVLEAKAIVRPIPEILKEVSGPNARKNWETLREAAEFDRMNAILRFLFAAVIISESTKSQGSFDYGRIDIEENPI